MCVVCVRVVSFHVIQLSYGSRTSLDSKLEVFSALPQSEIILRGHDAN